MVESVSDIGPVATFDQKVDAWIVDDAEACKALLVHDSLATPPYAELYAELESHFGLDFSNMRFAFNHIPLWLHGARHTAARK